MTATLTGRLTRDLTTEATAGVLFQGYPDDWFGYKEPKHTQKSWPRPDPWVHLVLSIPDEALSHSITEIKMRFADSFVPRTPLGRKLLSLRIRAIEAGMKLLSADEVLEEVKRRRGEPEDDEANVH